MFIAFEFFIDSGDFAMLESAYPYTSGATGENSFDCLYSASKATNVSVKSNGWSLKIKASIQKQP